MIINRFIWFDFFRAASAILVLISHLRALIFEDFSGSSNVLCKFFYFITGFGHQAVIFFFVLSGFFIIRNIHESTINEKWNVSEYGVSTFEWTEKVKRISPNFKT